ncbi:hypothetical protein TNCV_4910271 [Trichonephila clavipes]|nr:hypothetical protein TNCV_4910271 [Trichonephila clavipes]
MIPARTWPCRAAYSNASGLWGRVTGTTVVERCSGKASIGSMTNEKGFKTPLAFIRFKRDAIQQGLQKEAVASLNASVTVPTLMVDPRHHG